MVSARPLGHAGSPFGLLKCCVLLLPFFEECAFRGYLYMAFRNEYSVIWSVVSVVAVMLVFHPDTFSSLNLVLGLIFLNVATCLLREKAQNLWPCITCHVVYNLMAALLID